MSIQHSQHPRLLLWCELENYIRREFKKYKLRPYKNQPNGTPAEWKWSKLKIEFCEILLWLLKLLRILDISTSSPGDESRFFVMDIYKGKVTGTGVKQTRFFEKNKWFTGILKITSLIFWFYGRNYEERIILKCENTIQPLILEVV